MSNFISAYHSQLIIAVVALVTIAIRFLPFVIFKGETPKALAYLGKVLLSAVMAMLLVFCLKNVSFASVSGFMPELISLAVCFGIHKWRHNTLLSIIAATVCYMLLIQLVFV